MVRDSLFGTEHTQTAEMTNKLKAAEPTIVPGPNSPDWNLQLDTCLFVGNCLSTRLESIVFRVDRPSAEP